jgi:glutathione S-transferase
MGVTFYDLCGRDPNLRFSPYCWRARMSLAHKGVHFETRPTAFTEIPGIENGAFTTVPVINDNGRIVSDSFDIALFLDERYPDAPPLFTDRSAVAAAQFMDSWAYQHLHAIVTQMVLKDIHDVLGDADQSYFRPSREARFGRPLEQHQTGLDSNTEAFRTALEPLRRTLARHDWLGGDAPRFADYIPFGSLMWLRTIAGCLPLLSDDPVRLWFERCLDLYDGVARQAPVAKAA